MTTTTKHTPGPWKAQKHQGMTSDKNGNAWHTIRDSRNCYVAQLEQVDGLTTPSMDSNASLIAAAPELLEALQAVTWVLLKFRPMGEDSETNTALSRAHAAIERATR